MAILLAGSSFAQGKGHGKGGGGGNQGGPPPGQQRQGGGNPGGGGQRQGGGNPGGGQQRQMGGGGGGWQQQQRQVQQVQRQQAQQWQHAQRQQQMQQQAQRQQWQQAQRQQRDAIRQQMQQQRQWQNVQRQQQRVYSQPPQQRVYTQPRPNWGQVRREQAFEAKRQRDVLKAQQHADRDAWKYARKQQHFEDKAFRQAQRQYSSPSYEYRQRDSWLGGDVYQPSYRDYRSYEPTYRDYRTYEPVYPQYYQPVYPSYDYSTIYTPYSGYVYNYDDTGYYGYQRTSWVEPLIRSVIASFFSNGIDGGYYDDYTYGQPYYGSNYGYAPQYAYYQPTYYTFGYQPAYTYYEPAAYYGYDQYAYNSMPYDVFQGALPYDDVRYIYSGGVAGELIQRALGTGYYQGLLEGQLARQRGWGDRYYADPYLYEQAIYDPYSSSLGDCRRYFSEGYEMGYDDALRGRDQFDLADGGDVDLVSLLLGNVLSLRG